LPAARGGLVRDALVGLPVRVGRPGWPIRPGRFELADSSWPARLADSTWRPGQPVSSWLVRVGRFVLAGSTWLARLAGSSWPVRAGRVGFWVSGVGVEGGRGQGVGVALLDFRADGLPRWSVRVFPSVSPTEWRSSPTISDRPPRDATTQHHRLRRRRGDWSLCGSEPGPHAGSGGLPRGMSGARSHSVEPECCLRGVVTTLTLHGVKSWKARPD
jgi:hypothetical protein